MIRFALLSIICGALLAVPEPVCGQASAKVARGARLWNATCNRCHNRRSPMERTDSQWDVIVSHMRTRANLTKNEAQAIAAFLKRANGRQGGGTASVSGKADSSATPRKYARVGEKDNKGEPRRFGDWLFERLLRIGVFPRGTDSQ